MNFIDKPINNADSQRIAVAGQKVVNLALQGGGSHGAFTWGVLDRLIEEERLSFEGISASSAGSIDAVKRAKAERLVALKFKTNKSGHCVRCLRRDLCFCRLRPASRTRIAGRSCLQLGSLSSSWCRPPT